VPSVGPNPFAGVKNMSNFNDRIIRAAKLDASVYEEVEEDTTALKQAMAVVVLSSIAAGIGTTTSGGLSVIMVIITGTILALIGWYIWAYITYFIGTRLLPEPQTKADYGQLLRTIGFSSSPGLIRIFCIIPGLSGIISVIAAVWMLVAMVVAVRQALDYRSTFRAVAVCIIGWIIQSLFLIVVLAIIGNLLK
jgi:hypothetical protein